VKSRSAKKPLSGARQNRRQTLAIFSISVFVWILQQLVPTFPPFFLAFVYVALETCQTVGFLETRKRKKERMERERKEGKQG
jgi:hypothetical protein